ncbi:conjugal transfer protein TraK [Acidithiobacillus ferrivorans]|nr:conjugal transfer protein TraK [Acidithiobacillus ferrivorans]
MMRRYWILCALALWPVTTLAGVMAPPPPTDSALTQGASLGQQGAAEYQQASAGSAAFAQGANNGSGRFVMPSSPDRTSNLQQSPAFASLGHIPAAPSQPELTGGRMPAPMPPSAPGSAPYMPTATVTPPPAGANPYTIHSAAMNTYGASNIPPHMSFKAARIGSIPVSTTDIRIVAGSTYAVPVSGVTPNLFATPFAHPRIIVGNKQYAQHFQHGSDAIISVTPSFPVGVYITGENSSDPVASLTLIPKNSPAKNYRLVFPGFVPKRAPRMPYHSAYASVMVNLIRDAVLDQVPDNYRQSRRIPDLVSPDPLSWSGLHHWIGGHYQIVSYKLTNHVHQAVDLAENDFYQKGVLSVAFYPHHKLYPGESTQLYLVEALPASHRGLGAVW